MFKTFLAQWYYGQENFISDNLFLHVARCCGWMLITSLEIHGTTWGLTFRPYIFIFYFISSLSSPFEYHPLFSALFPSALLPSPDHSPFPFSHNHSAYPVTSSYLILNPLPPTPQPSLFHPTHPSNSALLITHPSTLSPHWNLSIPFFAHQPPLLNHHSSPHLFFTLSTIYFPLLSPYSLCHLSPPLYTFHSSPHTP